MRMRKGNLLFQFNESYSVQYFPVVPFIMIYKVVLTFESVDEILSVAVQMKAI